MQNNHEITHLSGWHSTSCNALPQAFLIFFFSPPAATHTVPCQFRFHTFTHKTMTSNTMKISALITMTFLFCAASHAQVAVNQRSDVDVTFVIEHRKDGKRGGSVSHTRSTKDLAASPLVHTLVGLDDRSSVVIISYVGYANFEIAGNGKHGEVKPGQVFAVQVFSGKKGVTIKTAQKNVTKLVTYQNIPQVLHEDANVSVTIQNPD